MMDSSEVLEHEERAAAPSSNIKDIRRSAMDYSPGESIVV